MGVDHPRGPDRGPEAADKVSPQGTRDQAPADPAGDNQQPLGDRSIEAESDTEKDPEADKTYVGSLLAEEPDDTVDPAEVGNGGTEAEEPGPVKVEDPRGNEDERVNDDRGPGTGQPEAGGAGGQDDHNREPRPQDGASSADDKTDDPEAPQQPDPVSTKNAAPPEPFSRLKSLARAREAQLQNAEQLRAVFRDAQTADGDRGTPPQSENAGSEERGPEAQPAVAEIPGGTDDDTGEPPAEPAAADEATTMSKPTRLEGRRDYVVEDPAVPGRTITDIDSIEDGVLWEEKSATNAGDIGRWVAKHIDKKFSSYLDARQFMADYEQAPIGFRFTSPGADPGFRSEVESAVERLRQAYPNEQIMLEWP